jgi:hypothetical protein
LDGDMLITGGMQMVTHLYLNSSAYQILTGLIPVVP